MQREAHGRTPAEGRRPTGLQHGVQADDGPTNPDRREDTGRAQPRARYLARRDYSATILLIPGTSSVAHLRENITATNIKLPADAVDELDRIGAR